MFHTGKSPLGAPLIIGNCPLLVIPLMTSIGQEYMPLNRSFHEAMKNISSVKVHLKTCSGNVN